MTVYTVGGQKGGVGKSTIAVHLAAELLRRGRAVVLVDADRQRSASTWAARAVHGLRIEVTDDRARLLELAQTPGDVVVDCVGAVDELHLVSLFAADRVVLPCGPGMLDLAALRATANLVAQARAMRRSDDPQAVVLLNRVDPRTLIAREAMAIVAELGLPIVGTVRASVAVSDAPGQGRLVDGPAGDDLRAACARILDGNYVSAAKEAAAP